MKLNDFITLPPKVAVLQACQGQGKCDYNFYLFGIATLDKSSATCWF